MSMARAALWALIGTRLCLARRSSGADDSTDMWRWSRTIRSDVPEVGEASPAPAAGAN